MMRSPATSHITFSNNSLTSENRKYQFSSSTHKYLRTFHFHSITLALKFQKLTTETLLRPSQLRLVQGSTIIIRTYKHGWKTIHNLKPHRKLPPMVPSRTLDKSPRVRSNERQGSNNRESEEKSPEEDLSLGKLFVIDLFIITSRLSQMW